jgi:Tol biopolymer transport system component
VLKASCQVSNPSWSPDGRRILYESVDANDLSMPNGIYVVPSDGRDVPRRIAAGSSAGWAPDGAQVLFLSQEAYGADWKLCVQALDATRARCLPTPGGLLLHPSWSPDGQQIMFVVESDRSDIYLVRADGSQLAHTVGPGGRSPRWSPDGSAILFEGGDPITQQPALCALTLASSEQHCVITSALDMDQSAWSPDGKELLYIGMESEENTQYGLYRAQIGGTARVRLAWNSFLHAPVWSPDGRLIAFEG